MMGSKNPKILITGANGFVGRALCHKLVTEGFPVRAAVRRGVPSDEQEAGVEYVSVGEIDTSTKWHSILNNIDCIVHLAARVHVMKENALDPLKEFMAVNAGGTERLIREAASAGVKRLVYLSTIKVNGEETHKKPFTENIDMLPSDPYSLSKWEAEQHLYRVATETGIEVVVIRPPLIYGEGVKGNLLTLMSIISKGVPLPLGTVNNRRSLIALRNLVDLIRECIVNPAAAGETFVVSDGYDLSTPELIKALARGMGKSPRLIPVPLSLLTSIATLVGKRGILRRLLGSLQVDNSYVCRRLDWQPPYSTIDELSATAQWFCSQKKRVFKETQS